MATPTLTLKDFPRDSTPVHIGLPLTTDQSGRTLSYTTSAETVNSAPFTIDRGCLAVSISIPALVGGADTVRLQKLYQPADNQQSQTWQDVQVFNLSDGTFTALTAIPQNKATTLPGAATGSGVFRLVASADQSSAPVTVQIDQLITR